MPRYPKISLNSNKSKDMHYGDQRISMNGYQHGYQNLISKDIFFHSRYFRVYPAIFFISCNSFIYIQLFIHSYPVFYPRISIHILFFVLLFILIYPHRIQLFYPCISCYLSLCILTYPADYSIRFSADPARRGVLLDRTLFCMSCSATG